MTDFEPKIPAYYMCKPGLTPKELDLVTHALTFTPVAAVVVTDPYDGEQANKFSLNIFTVPSLTCAHDWARLNSVDRTILIIGGTDVLVAYFTDGTNEVLTA